MKPLPTSEDGLERRLSIEAQWNVKTCNDMKDFDVTVISITMYKEAEKLVVGKKN